MKREGKSCSQTAVSAEQSPSNREGASGAICPEAGRWTTGLLEAPELKGQALWQEMMGGIPEVPAGDLGESWPPLCSPLLPTAGPCSPRAPAWNPGLAAASAPTLSSAQLSSAGHRTIGCPRQLRRRLIYLLCSPILLWQLPLSLPLPHPSPCTNHSKSSNSNNQGHTARPACRTQFYSFPTFRQ